MNILDRSFFQRDTVIVARDLLGMMLTKYVDGKRLMGRIVETEAYCFANDPASHAYRGKTKRNAPMFGTVGSVYVYFIYGNHFCFNIVAKKDSPAGAVLIRGVQPMRGIAIMKKHRQHNDIYQLTNGPGKLAQAFNITTHDNCIDVTQRGTLFMTEGKVPVRIVATTRTGISVGKDKLWRFCIAGNKWLSRKVT